MTQQIFDSSEENLFEEEWEVVMNTKAKYILSKMQALILKQAIATGNRGTIMFQTFAIPIPYLVEFYRVRRFLKDSVQLKAQATEQEYTPIDPKKFEELKKDIYRKLGKK
jgi:hypothetical protein